MYHVWLLESWRSGNTPLTCISEELERCVISSKCLGLIFESKVTFIPYIQLLNNECASLYILQFISSIEWDADSTVLINLYRSLIKSKFDYKCMLKDQYVNLMIICLIQFISLSSKLLHLITYMLKQTNLHKKIVPNQLEGLTFRFRLRLCY